MSETISVLYFASLREALQCEQEQVSLPAAAPTVAQLIEQLVQGRDESWQQLQDPQQVLVAVNQRIVDRSTSLSGGDEVAFFPPMTGG